MTLTPPPAIDFVFAFCNGMISAIFRIYEYGISLIECCVPLFQTGFVEIANTNLFLFMVAFILFIVASKTLRTVCVRGPVLLKEHTPQLAAVQHMTAFDLAKTAYMPGHMESVIQLIERMNFDVNSPLPSNGLTLFLCSCLSGQRSLVRYMLSKGANVHSSTKTGEGAMYLATYGILNSAHPDLELLNDLCQAGCDVNKHNVKGYTSLHRAASKGNKEVIGFLLEHGADPYNANKVGIYPIDSAINAGHVEIAEMLKIEISNPYVWDVVDPHTPPSISLGLQSPRRQHLIESSRPRIGSRSSLQNIGARIRSPVF